jgi:hypothetical protein
MWVKIDAALPVDFSTIKSGKSNGSAYCGILRGVGRFRIVKG